MGMAKRNPLLNWDELLDGKVHRLNLDDIGWERGLNDLRAKIHYEADRRRGIAHTHKIDAVTLEFYAEGARVVVRSTANCTCGGGSKGPHVITCRALRDWPTPLLDEDHPDFVPPTGPAPAPAPADNTPTPVSEPSAADDEALLGPCTCGQSPTCVPGCARLAAAA